MSELLTGGSSSGRLGDADLKDRSRRAGAAPARSSVAPRSVIHRATQRRTSGYPSAADMLKRWRRRREAPHRPAPGRATRAHPRRGSCAYAQTNVAGRSPTPAVKREPRLPSCRTADTAGDALWKLAAHAGAPRATHRRRPCTPPWRDAGAPKSGVAAPRGGVAPAAGVGRGFAGGRWWRLIGFERSGAAEAVAAPTVRPRRIPQGGFRICPPIPASPDSSRRVLDPHRTVSDGANFSTTAFAVQRGGSPFSGSVQLLI